MNDVPRTLAVIPARGGSKRIPGKNIRPISGRPLMAWSIETALNSEFIDSVVVSTDSDEVARVAESAGALVPFKRPAELSDDYAGTVEVIAHAVRTLDPDASKYDYVLCLYPAAIFVRTHDLDQALADLTVRPDTDYAVSIVKFEAPIQRALSLDDGRIAMLDPALAKVRTQDLPARFHDAGQFYWGTSQAWREERGVFANSLGYELEPGTSQDIDDEGDWQRAELIHRMQLGG